MTTWKPVGLSAMHSRLVDLGAAMVETAGWQTPATFTSAQDEAERVRRAVGFCDVSATGKLLVQGDDVGSLLESTLPGLQPLDLGHVALLPSERVGSGRDIRLARLTADEVLVLTSPGGVESLNQTLDDSTGPCVHQVDLTSALAGVAIAGPEAPRLLSALTELDAAPVSFQDLSCAQGKLAEVHGVLVRCDLPGLLGYELYFGREYGEHMWDAIMEAGRDLEVLPFGTEALQLLAGR